MAGNPYTESGEKFRVPDMLTNRADTYNLSDDMKGREAAFSGSYIENAITSNPALQSLGKAAQKDIQAFIRKTKPISARASNAGVISPRTNKKIRYSDQKMITPAMWC